MHYGLNGGWAYVPTLTLAWWLNALADQAVAVMVKHNAYNAAYTQHANNQTLHHAALTHVVAHQTDSLIKGLACCRHHSLLEGAVKLKESCRSMHSAAGLNHAHPKPHTSLHRGLLDEHAVERLTSI